MQDEGDATEDGIDAKLRAIAQAGRKAHFLDVHIAAYRGDCKLLKEFLDLDASLCSARDETQFGVRLSRSLSLFVCVKERVPRAPPSVWLSASALIHHLTLDTMLALCVVTRRRTTRRCTMQHTAGTRRLVQCWYASVWMCAPVAHSASITFLTVEAQCRQECPERCKMHK